ncbi:hypothetical protein EZS27_004197 [termite gut metagenome]|uniref:Uncharacterized protein n=1 Tax=termite gut metagenome TaxID=433724 RepID=A0A5J4SQ42_9ZZZZ
MVIEIKKLEIKKINTVKKFVYLLIVAVFVSFGCRETVDIEIPENYEKADITGITVYNAQAVSITSSTSIANALKEVVVILGITQDLANLKVSLTISPGATVTQPLETNIQDFSQPRTVRIVSPGGSVENEWSIRIFNP